MKLAAALVAAVLLLAACSSSRAASKGPSVRSSTTRTATQPNYATAGQAVAAACSMLAGFVSDMEQTPPKDQVPHLQDAAAKIDFAAFSAYQDTDESSQYEQLDKDADALQTYISSPDFAANGNVEGQPIQAIQSDCP